MSRGCSTTCCETIPARSRSLPDIQTLWKSTPPSARFRRKRPSAWRTSPTSSGRSHMIQKRRSPLARSFRRWTIPSEEVVPVHERQKLMAMLRKYDFVLYELQLYLDTHPSCPHALRKWQEGSALRQKTASAYIRQFGPIQPRQTDGNAPWGWIEGPWPWEKEAN